jgi:protein-glutamine gamma-glutamyltransferase
MIEIAGSSINGEELLKGYGNDSIERKTINILSSSGKVYRYDSESRLKFELDVRRSIVNAALDLNRSHMKFRVFRSPNVMPITGKGRKKEASCWKTAYYRRKP